METKEEILKKLQGDNEIKGRNSMGVSESFYNKFYLTKSFLEEKTIDPNELSEKELNLLLDMADYAGDMFY